MPDPRYDTEGTFFEKDRDSQNGITDILSALMNPALADWLGGAFKGGLKGFVNEGSGMMGLGKSDPMGMMGMPFSQGAVFGPTNAGHSLYSAMTRSTLESMQTSIASADNARRIEMRMQAMQTLYPSMTESERATKALGTTLTNLGADWLLERATGARDFQKYAGYSALQAGMAAPLGLTGGARDAQMETNARISESMKTLTNLQMSNNMDLYGVSGNNAGILMAEMARTGQFSRPSSQLYGQSMNGAQEAVTLQKWASTVEPLTSFFGANVQQGMDQASGLLGVSALPTFGSDLGTMLREMKAAGRVTGMNNMQMLSLAAQSSQTAQAFGAEQFTSMGNAVIAAQTFKGALQAPGALRYVNELKLRESIVQRTTGAGASDLAMTISGAASMMDKDKQSAFMAALAGKGNLSGDDVSAIANQYGAKGTTADFLAASYTDAARDVRATGDPARAVLGSNIALMSDMRRGVAEQILGKSAAGDIANMTSEGLRNAPGMDNAKIGRIRRIWDDMARSAGYENSGAVDTVIRAGLQDDFVKQYAARTGALADMDESMSKFSRRGLASSYRNALIEAAKGGKSGKSALDLLNAFRGPDAEQLTVAGAKAISPEVAKLQAMYQAVGESDPEKETFGRATAMITEAIATGSISGRRVGKKELADYRAAIASGQDMSSLNARVLDKYSPEFQQKKRLGSLAKDMGMGYIGGNRRSLETMDFLDRMLADKDIKGMENAAELADTLIDADTYRQALTKTGGDVDKARTLTFGDDKEGYKRFAASIAKYRDKDESARGLGAGALEGAGAESVLSVLKDILGSLDRGFGSGGPPPTTPMDKGKERQ